MSTNEPLTNPPDFNLRVFLSHLKVCLRRLAYVHQTGIAGQPIGMTAAAEPPEHPQAETTTTIIDDDEFFLTYLSPTLFTFNELTNQHLLASAAPQTQPNQQSYLLPVLGRMFRIFFRKMAMLYASHVPHKIRNLIEYGVLFAGFLSFFTLIYLHILFIQSPFNCLESVQDNWPRQGILRIEIVDNDLDVTTGFTSFGRKSCSLANEFKSISQSGPDWLYGQCKPFKNISLELKPAVFSSRNSTFSAFYEIDANKREPIKIDDDITNDDHQLVEFSLEYGFLRLSPKTRQKLNIPVKVVKLNSNNAKCFGNGFSRFILKYFLGYENIIMGSLKKFSETQNNRGYVRNIVTGEYYRFVNVWMTKSAYFAVFFIMLVFTLSVSMLLRYSHQQVLLFVAEFMQWLEYGNSRMNLLFGPLSTVMLALVGMLAIMSEFFNDTAIAFYVIMIVWFADLYDIMACHTSTTRRNWLKFFYLYHFIFYAYDHRFNGQYSYLALSTSWLFILHSMVYFFHRYELPSVLR